MASLCTKGFRQVSRRNFSISSISCAFRRMPDPMELATGLEKRELLAKAAGIEDPFDQKLFKRGPGTKDSPNLIPSAFDARMVGCICEPEATHVNWMWLHKGYPKRCSCGHWFQLEEKAPLWPSNVITSTILLVSGSFGNKQLYVSPSFQYGMDCLPVWKPNTVEQLPMRVMWVEDEGGRGRHLGGNLRRQVPTSSKTCGL
uniref:Cytochrome c oxidase subunit Vb n=1 Tax=Timema poppense TaxID=170557 RepID=A0A7R9H847_TIMPO|nr:unnamed protein product [Timema poppensis]